MSSNDNPKYKTPKVLEPIEGKVPNCPNCNVQFVEPVAANYEFVCPSCNQPFNVTIKPEPKSEEKAE